MPVAAADIAAAAVAGGNSRASIVPHQTWLVQFDSRQQAVGMH